MTIFNVVEIFDNGEFVSIITDTKSAIHLPEGRHSLVIDKESKTTAVTVHVNLNEA